MKYLLLLALSLVLSISSIAQEQPKVDMGKHYDGKDVVMSLEGDSIVTRRFKFENIDQNCAHCLHLYQTAFVIHPKKMRFDITPYSVRIYENDSLYFENIFMIVDNHVFSTAKISFLLSGKVVMTVEQTGINEFMVAVDSPDLYVVKCSRLVSLEK